MGYIHLIRHGTTEANIARVYYGSTDIPLSNIGIDIISSLAATDIYPKPHGAYLYTTGLIRTEQTFFIIYGTEKHEVIEELREYHFGDFEMKTHDELIDNPDYQAWITDKNRITPCPNGESPTDFRNRVCRGFAKVVEKHKSSLVEDQHSIIVCHGGVISVIMGICFPNHEKNIFQWQPDPGRGYTLHIRDGEAVSFDEI